MSTAIVILLLVALIAWSIYRRMERNEGARKVVCPHCQQVGAVKLAPARVKRGISGGKAVAALFTFGISMLFAGLSRKERHLRARCGNCGVTWLI